MQNFGSLHTGKMVRLVGVVWLGCFLLLLNIFASPAVAEQARWKKLYPPEIEDKIARNEPVDLIVLLDDADEKKAEYQATQGEDKLYRVRYTDYQQRMQVRRGLLRNLKDKFKAEVVDTSIEVVTEYAVLPIVHVRVKSSQAFDALIENKRVLSIDKIRSHKLSLTESLPLIGRTDPSVSAYNGAGTTVAVLDTGVDYTKAAFGSCSAPGESCKVVYAGDFASNDGALDDNGHGTNVAAIVLGVAPAAKIAALDVFRQNGYAYDNEIIQAIDWCINNKATYNIASLNMSLGSQRHYGPIIPDDTFGVALQRAVDAGILVAASSGNNAYTDSIGFPAAYSNVFSVGAVYDSNLGPMSWSNCIDATTAADKVTCFSNSATFLTALAPGSRIEAAGISMSGTSQASPHVAGAAAVLRSAYSDDSVAQTTARLLQGDNVTDARNNITKTRLNLTKAIGDGFTLVTSVTPLGTGAVSPAYGVYDADAQVTLTAIPSPGCSFTGWGGDCTGAAPTCTVVMNADKSVTASFTAVLTPLTNGVAVNNLADVVDNVKHFYIDVPSGVSNLTIKTSGGTGDVDLYTRRNALPTMDNFDCRPWLTGNEESCTVTNPAAGRYYATLYAYLDYSGVSLRADYSAQTVQLSVSSGLVSESAASITLLVTRLGGTKGTVKVKYATANGTAKATTDYRSNSGTLTWGDGDSSVKSIIIPIVNDRAREGMETFMVNLSEVTGAMLGTNSTATITILDND